MSATLHRWSRRLGLVATGVLTLVVAVLALLQLPPVATWVARHLIPLLPLNPGYRLEVGRVSGDWIHGLEFQDVRLLHRGRELARAERLELGYDPRRLTGETTRLEELVLEHAVLRAHREGGRWDLANALHRSTDTSAAGPSRAFAVDRVALRGIQLAAQFSPDSVLRVRSMTLLGRGLRLGEHVLLTIQELTGAVSPPGTARFFSVATRGTLTREAVRLDPIRVQTEETDVAASVVLPYDLAEPGQADRLRLVVRAHPLAMADLAAVVPAVTPRGELRLDATARGEGRLIVAHLAARLGGATVRLGGDVTLERGRPVRYRARGEVARLDPAGWLRAAPAGDLNGALTADVRGATLRESSGELAVRLSGSRVGARALRRLDFRAELDSGRADVALSGAVGESSLRATGWIRPFESAPSYRLAGNALRLPGTDALVRALAGSDGSPSLDARFRIAGAGLSPRAAHASGGVQLAAVRRDGSRTPLGRSSFAVAAGRIEARPELLAGGGRISALATARLGDPLRYRIRRGAIAGVDLGGMLGDTVSAPVNGRFSLTGRGTAPAAAVVRARVELDSLRYGTRRLDGLAATLRLAGGTARADLHATLQGGSIALDARARPFDSIPSFAVRRA
ncbi:MAG TPA: hypothetical protein VFK09_01290, partial [Gemmatimonadales bacterium]|nr:hypothetical protein [Gemmatimonadales bacterium]